MRQPTTRSRKPRGPWPETPPAPVPRLRLHGLMQGNRQTVGYTPRLLLNVAAWVKAHPAEDAERSTRPVPDMTETAP